MARLATINELSAAMQYSRSTFNNIISFTSKNLTKHKIKSLRGRRVTHYEVEQIDQHLKNVCGFYNKTLSDRILACGQEMEV